MKFEIGDIVTFKNSIINYNNLHYRKHISKIYKINSYGKLLKILSLESLDNSPNPPGAYAERLELVDYEIKEEDVL